MRASGRVVTSSRIGGKLRGARLGGDEKDALRAALTAAGLPADDIAAPGVQRFGFKIDQRTVGYGGLEIHDNAALLRSIVVDPCARREGVGSRIVEALLDRAADQAALRAFLLTTDAAGYFRRLGFAALDRKEAPPAILATRQAAGLCPATATLMAKTLVRGPQ